MPDIYTINLESPAYPPLLREISNPPSLLYVRGTLPARSTCLAVVGTRRNTRYGQQVTAEFSNGLARAGLCIVSGLALGIDGLAHEAALTAKGQTIAVLGSGIDDNHIYPATHRSLAKRIIAAGGAIISEYPPGFVPSRYSFPARNRIIAGLSIGTLVTEAPRKSGALITAYHALDFNREVFAVPHAITSLVGYGCNSLIARGAMLVTSPVDILHAIGIKPKEDPLLATQLTKIEAAIYNQLTREPRHVDALIEATTLDGQMVAGTLTVLELQGLVKHLGGHLYVKNN